MEVLMLSNITFIFIGFINLFLVPFMGLKLFLNRHDIPVSFSIKCAFFYILILVLNLPLTSIFVNIVESLLSTTIYVETSRYTVVSLISCITLPFIMEIFEKLFHIEINIFLRYPNKEEKTSANSEETHEK